MSGQRHLEEELRKKETVVERGIGNVLPQIESLRPTTPEDEAKAKEEVMKRRELAQEVGPQLAECRREIARLKALPKEDLDLSPTNTARLAYFENWEKTLLTQKITESGLKASIEFSAFLTEIRKAKPEQADRYVAEAVAKGRIRVTNRATSATADPVIFWSGKGYEAVPDAAGKVSAANIGLMGELRKLTDAAKTARKKEREAKIEAMRAADLTLTTVCVGKPGKIYCFIPRHEETGSRGKYWIGEAHLSVRFDGKNLSPLEAVGGKGLEDSWGEISAKQIYVTLAELRKGKLGQIKDWDTWVITQKYLNILLDAKKAIPAPPAAPPSAAPPSAAPPAETVAPLTPGVDGKTPGVDTPVTPPPASKPKKPANIRKKNANKDKKNGGTN